MTSDLTLDSLQENLNFNDFKKSQKFLQPESYLGISKLENNYFKFLNDHLIITSNATNLLHYDLIEENFQIIPNDDFFPIKNFFSFENTSYLILQEAKNSNKMSDFSKLHFIDYNYGANFPKKTILLEPDFFLINVSISSDNTKFCLLDQKNTNTFLSIWCLDQLVIVDKIQLNQGPTHVCFFPNDSRKIIVFGDDCLQTFIVDKNEKILSQWNFGLPANYTSFEWLNSNEILLGDDCGHVVLFNVHKNEITKNINVSLEIKYFFDNLNKLDDQDDENNEFEFNKNIFTKKNIENLHDLEKRIEIFSDLTIGSPIRQILRANNGFICLSGSHEISIYQTNSIDEFSLKHFCQVIDEYSDNNGTNELHLSSSNDIITRMGINKSKNCLICFSESKNIYKLDLTSDHIYKKSILRFKLINSFHYTKILSIDTCYQKPLMVTYAQEGIIKIWNFIDKKIEYSKKLEDNVACVAIHPTGLYLSVSFLNKIDLYSIILNDLKKIFSFKISHCNFMKFSNGGNQLAASSLNTIKIFNVWTFEKNVQIKQRIGKIQHFMWLEDDQCIVSCSNSGIICIWNAYTGHRLYEYIEKQVQFKQISISNTENNLVIFALDKFTSLRVLSCKYNKAISSEVNTNTIEDITLEKIIDLKLLDTSFFCSFGNTLFFGNHKGHILHYNYSVDKENKWQIVNDNFYQNCSISQILISNCMNRIFLISAFEDGLMVLCNLSDINEEFLMPSPVSRHSITNQTNQETNLKLDPQPQEFFNDILITKNDIKKIISNNLNLKQIIIEQEDDQNYQLKLKDMIHKEQTKTINYEAKLNLTCLRSLYKEIKQINEDKFKKNYHRLDKLKFKLQKDLQIAKENAEFELNKKFVLSDRLSSQFQELNTINKDILDGIKRLSESNTISTKLGSNNSKNIEKNRASELHGVMKSKLEHLRKVISFLNSENFEMEFNQDEMFTKMVTFNKQSIDSVGNQIRNFKTEICFVRKKIHQIKDKFSLLKERQKKIEENFLKEKKNHSVKLEQIESCKKAVELRQKDLDFKLKNKSEMTRKIEQLKKINYILKFELEQVRNTTDKFKVLNDNLKNLIDSFEENLSRIIQKKIFLLKQMNHTSNIKVFGILKKKPNLKNDKFNRQFDLKNPKLLKSFFQSCKSISKKKYEIF